MTQTEQEMHMKGPGSYTGRVHTKQDGADIMGTSIRNVMAHRSFYRDNKKIYSKKEHKSS